MTLGNKIKVLRKEKNITQKDLCADKITRNMLSEIENDKAQPSLQTLLYLAARLDVPPSYLVSESEDLFTFKKSQLIEMIKDGLKKRRFTEVLELCSSLGGTDDEIAYIMTVASFELGFSALKNGSFESARSSFESSLANSQKTVYDTSKYTHRIPLYLAVCKNATAPLLEFDSDAFLNELSNVSDLDFYKYLVQDLNYTFKNAAYAKHITAKQYIKERKYTDAITLLKEIEDEKNKISPNAYFTFSVYGDLEICYRQLYDFENAYRYSTKRISMLEGFKS